MPSNTDCIRRCQDEVLQQPSNTFHRAPPMGGIIIPELSGTGADICRLVSMDSSTPGHVVAELGSSVLQVGLILSSQVL